jgi:hypothetical protein
MLRAALSPSEAYLMQVPTIGKIIAQVWTISINTTAIISDSINTALIQCIVLST